MLVLNSVGSVRIGQYNRLPEPSGFQKVLSVARVALALEWPHLNPMEPAIISGDLPDPHRIIQHSQQTLAHGLSRIPLTECAELNKQPLTGSQGCGENGNHGVPRTGDIKYLLSAGGQVQVRTQWVFLWAQEQMAARA